jgi:hypothetical protein
LQHVDVREWVPWFDRHCKKLPNPDEFVTCLLFCLAISFEHVVEEKGLSAADPFGFEIPSRLVGQGGLKILLIDSADIDLSFM